ncbi:hypothetical protein MCEMSEM18_03500 [Comamonadaceae bacterium]
MFERIDIYVKAGKRWKYVDCTRMHKTLESAQRHYGPSCQARWSERGA